MTLKQYLADSTLYASTAKVLDILRGETSIVRLDKTIFHPQGGGQKADRGRIGPVAVLHVTHNADNVDHHVDSVSDLDRGMEVRLEVDILWRKINAVHHTAGHLIASVVEELYPGVQAISGHQWPGEGRVEFVGEPSRPIAISDVNERIANELTDKLPVLMQGDPFSSRSIKIGHHNAIPCGGTHVSSLGEIGSVIIKSVKTKSGRIKISYEASPDTVS